MQTGGRVAKHQVERLVAVRFGVRHVVLEALAPVAPIAERPHAGDAVVVKSGLCVTCDVRRATCDA